MSLLSHLTDSIANYSILCTTHTQAHHTHWFN